MRARYCKPGENKRVRIITNNVDALAKLDKALDSQGFQQVGLIRFLLHLITAGRRKKAKSVDSSRK
jgi:hypothetical protein